MPDVLKNLFHLQQTCTPPLGAKSLPGKEILQKVQSCSGGMNFHQETEKKGTLNAKHRATRRRGRVVLDPLQREHRFFCC